MVPKSGVIFLLFVLLLPVVAADISLDLLSASTYNFGDSFTVTGSVVSNSSLRGYVGLDLVCGGGVIPLTTTLVELDAGISESFSRLITLPDGGNGTCSIRAVLRNGNFDEIASVLSNSFSISNSLKGTFTLSDTAFQLGDTLVLQGDIGRLDGTAIDGTATLTFVRGGTTVMTQSVAVQGGLLDYVQVLSLLPAGTYHIDVVITDSLGNSQTFASAASFTLDDQLVVFLQTMRDNYLPGESVFLSGTVETRSGALPIDPSLTLTVGGEEFTQQALGGSFNFEYRVPSTAKAQMYTVDFVARDADGNYGTTTSRYTVVQVPTSLSLDLTELSVDPGASLSFEAIFLDQAGDLYESTVRVTLLNPKEEQIFSSDVQSNEAHDVTFDVFAVPGPWRLTVEAEELFDDVTVTVVPKEALVTSLDGSDISLRNVGNVVWSAPVTFDANGVLGQQEFSLEVNESTTYDLRELFPDGNYTISVIETGEVYSNVELSTPSLFSRLSGGLKKVFGGSSTGSAVVDTTSGTSGGGSLVSIFFYGVLALALLGFVFFFYKKRQSKGEDNFSDYSAVKYTSEDRERDRQQAVQRKAEIKADKKQEPKYKFGVASEEDIKDFRKRMAQSFAEEQERQQRNSYQTKNPPPSGNVFSMFD